MFKKDLINILASFKKVQAELEIFVQQTDEELAELEDKAFLLGEDLVKAKRSLNQINNIVGE